MGRPVWLLDVDGVLNAARPGWGAAPHAGTAYSDGESYRLRWAPALVDRIRALHRAGTVEIRWCTTWCSDADQVERLLSLPRFERCWHHRLGSTAAALAKLAAARDIVDRGGWLIWTDDEVVPTAGPVHDELTVAGRTLLIAPSPSRGLQPEHLDAIEAFLAAIPAAPADPVDPVAEARRLLGG
jgi:hypothetical protein